MNEHAVEMASGNLQAMGDGDGARRAGQPREANPWGVFRPERRNWDQGWTSADRQVHDEARRETEGPPSDAAWREADRRLREQVEAALASWHARGG